MKGKKRETSHREYEYILRHGDGCGGGDGDDGRRGGGTDLVVVDGEKELTSFTRDKNQPWLPLLFLLHTSHTSHQPPATSFNILRYSSHHLLQHTTQLTHAWVVTSPRFAAALST
ncbi:hypothetical protein E2C01_101084 [Portunus trituberculatus]|uniref:Uncharacterized protein n=1 Tax=Portunus trituberculatus TaxID=210409 RepID=A0A5B7KL35_PORTR|nr:hypothetical protein [Portunus trituberculatus]